MVWRPVKKVAAEVTRLQLLGNFGSKMEPRYLGCYE
jgi:hypothetical protein